MWIIGLLLKWTLNCLYGVKYFTCIINQSIDIVCFNHKDETFYFVALYVLLGFFKGGGLKKRLARLFELIDFLLFFLWVALQYEYISDKKTLSEAHDFCMKRGSKLSDLQENLTLVSQECSDNCIGEDLWTSASAAPYLSILGKKTLIWRLTSHNWWLIVRKM